MIERKAPKKSPATDGAKARPGPFARRFAALIVQIGIAFLGGASFAALGIPAAWLSGAVVATVIWGAAGRGVTLPRPLADAAMLLSGVTMGAGITPEAVAAIGRYPASLGLLAVAVVAITAGSMVFLVRFCAWRSDDALLASVPGALSSVMAIAADRDADVSSIVIVQAFRLLVLITLLPTGVSIIGGSGAAEGFLGASASLISPGALAVILAASLAAGLVFERLAIAAPILLGGTLISSLVHATSLVGGVMPSGIVTLGLVLIGVFIGERFRTLNGRAFRRLLPATIGSFLVGMALAAAFAGMASWVTGIGLGDAMVAFAPGGLEAMMILALVLGLDPLYVGVHHFARFIGIGLCLPFVFTRLRGRPGAS